MRPVQPSNQISEDAFGALPVDATGAAFKPDQKDAFSTLPLDATGAAFKPD